MTDEERDRLLAEFNPPDLKNFWPIVLITLDNCKVILEKPGEFRKATVEEIAHDVNEFWPGAQHCEAADVVLVHDYIVSLGVRTRRRTVDASRSVLRRRTSKLICWPQIRFARSKSILSGPLSFRGRQKGNGRQISKNRSPENREPVFFVRLRFKSLLF